MARPRLEQTGLVNRIVVSLGESDRALLDDLVGKHGSKSAAIRALIRETCASTPNRMQKSEPEPESTYRLDVSGCVVREVRIPDWAHDILRDYQDRHDLPGLDAVLEHLAGQLDRARRKAGRDGAHGEGQAEGVRARHREPDDDQEPGLPDPEPGCVVRHLSRAEQVAIVRASRAARAASQAERAHAEHRDPGGDSAPGADPAPGAELEPDPPEGLSGTGTEPDPVPVLYTGPEPVSSPGDEDSARAESD